MDDNQVDRLMRRLRLRHIELLVALGDLPTLHAAAQRLSLSQPAVSKMLREVEEVFDAVLFDRTKSGVHANTLGIVAVRWARIIFHDVQAATEELAVVKGGSGSLLRLGTISVTSIVPDAIVNLRKSVPTAVVHIREGAVDVLIDRLLTGELDCVFGALAPVLLGRADVASLHARTVYEDRLCIVASPRHRLASARRLSWVDLEEESWVLPPHPTVVRQTFIAAHLQRGLRLPRTAVETLSPVTVWSLVRSDRNLLGLVRSEQFRGAHGTNPLIELPVSPVVQLPPLSLFTRRSRAAETPLVERFYAALMEESASRPH
jgi:DNA-binding transcriptional LysR family regulator